MTRRVKIKAVAFGGLIVRILYESIDRRKSHEPARRVFVVIRDTAWIAFTFRLVTVTFVERMVLSPGPDNLMVNRRRRICATNKDGNSKTFDHRPGLRNLQDDNLTPPNPSRHEPWDGLRTQTLVGDYCVNEGGRGRAARPW